MSSSLPVILIIEDDKVLQEMYLEQFSQAGFSVLQALDGETAVEVFRAHPEIRVMIVDVMLPKLSGFEVIRQIREMALDRDVPIIMFSALGDEKNQEEGMNAGATMVAAKGDTSLKEVIQRAREYVEQ